MVSSWWAIPILAYHRVGEPKGDHVPTLSAEAFERQLQLLARYRYAVLDFGDVATRLAQGQPLPRHSTAITFDDGYEETSTIAAPLLHTFGFRATVFVTPAEVGTPGFMSWEQVKQGASNGLTIGSHTMHHTYLPLSPADKVERELVESKRVLEQQLGRAVPWLSYPVGGYSSAIQSIAKQAGYQAACTTNRGVAKRGYDLFALRRIKMTERDANPLLLRAKLSGYYDLFRRLERPS